MTEQEAYVAGLMIFIVGSMILACWLMDHYGAWHRLSKPSKPFGKRPTKTEQHRRARRRLKTR